MEMEEMDRILCDEQLEEVLRLLPPRSTFSPSTADVSLVSKRWLRLYRSSRSTLSLRLSSDNCTPQSLSSFLSHFPRLSHLLITIFSDDLLSSVASSCPPELTHLCLQPNPVSLSPLFSLSTLCPHLTSLFISLSPPLSFHWLLHFPSLQQLDVAFASLSTGSSTSPLFNNLDGELKLETLTLEGIGSGDYDLDGLWKRCKKLKKLQLHRCLGIGDDTSVSSFNNCLKGLQEVELWCCGSIVNDILTRLLENCTSLNSLLISTLLIGEVGRERLLQFITHSRCNLRKLYLRLPRALGDNHLLAVAEKFSGLLSLRLESCPSVSHEGLTTMALAMSNNKLEELALIDCHIEPGLLTTLGQSFRNLRKLDLSYNDKLADEEFTSMLASFNCLKELYVRGCNGLTNASVVSMFMSCEQLETVDLLSCDGIEAEAVELFVLNCLRLRQIYVEESKLSDVSRSWASKKFIEVIFR
ncbi:hypothetical protein C3L33_01643, partial [Rhododendron williamsianum]